MTRPLLLQATVASVLVSSAAFAYGAEPNILSDQRERPNQPLSRQQHVELSAFSDIGGAPCQSGVFSVSLPNSRSLRCVFK